ncbi:MAG: ABC transporter permease [Acidobacteriota bacterium]
METIWKDLQYAARTLLRNPGFTLVAILTLAIGIGANTAIFTVVNAILVRALPYPESNRLVAVLGHDTKAQDDHTYLSFDDFNDYRRDSRSFDFLTGFTPQWNFTLTGVGDTERLTGIYASASVFPLLGIQPVLGRGFSAEEDRVGGAQVALLSYGLWQRKFGGDRTVVGRQLAIDGVSIAIVGVMPRDFRWLEEGDVWRPLAQNPVMQRGRSVRLVFFTGRLKPGITGEAAQTEFDALAARLTEQFPVSNTNIGANLVPLHREFSGTARPVLLALLGAVALVLLIACVNVANLLLARARTRARELAIRMALGATRSRLIVQLLTESMLMALLAGALGLLLAFWGVDLLSSLSPVDLSRQTQIAIDRPVLLFTLGLAVLTGVFFGLVPALQGSSASLTDALKEGSRGTVGASQGRALRALVIAEVALALVVTIASGLLLRSFMKLQGVNPGFTTEHVLTFDLPLPARYSTDANARLNFYKRFYAGIEALPGVVAVGDVTRLPLAGRAGNPSSTLAIEGANVPPGERPQVDFRRGGHEYFRAMGIPLVGGRLFDDRDSPQTEPVAIINQIAARHFFEGQDPIGKRIGFGNEPTPQWLRIVGIVGDVRHVGLKTEPRPEAYISASQAPPFAPVVVVRTITDETALTPAIRKAIQQIDTEVPMFNVLTLGKIRTTSLAQARFQVLLFGLFGGVALLLAMLGVYGVMAYSVSQRTNELGIRLALGARRADVLRLVVGEGAKLAAAGIAIGVPVALLVSRLLSGLLFGIKPADVLTYVGVALLLAAVSILACYLPARRAAAVDPMVALRQG